jgi:hypothetical protein
MFTVCDKKNVIFILKFFSNGCSLEGLLEPRGVKMLQTDLRVSAAINLQVIRRNKCAACCTLRWIATPQMIQITIWN